MPIVLQVLADCGCCFLNSLSLRSCLSLAPFCAGWHYTGPADEPKEEGAGAQEETPALPLRGQDEGGGHSQAAPRPPHVRPDRAPEHRESLIYLLLITSVYCIVLFLRSSSSSIGTHQAGGEGLVLFSS